MLLKSPAWRLQRSRLRSRSASPSSSSGTCLKLFSHSSCQPLETLKEASSRFSRNSQTRLVTPSS